MHITFSHASMLLWLPVAWLVVALSWSIAWLTREKLRSRYGDKELVDSFSRRESRRLVAFQFGCWLCVITLLMMAAAHPVMTDEPQSVPAGSVRLVTILDVSKSMGAEDYRATMPADSRDAQGVVLGPHGSRLAMAKYTIVHQIMPAVRDNKLALVTFTRDPWPQAPCTTDFVSLQWVLDHWVGLGSAPGAGSDYVAGLRGAVETIKQDHDAAKLDNIVILFSDGGWTQDQTGLTKVLEQMKQLRIKLLVVGVGDTNPQPIPVYQADGVRSGWYQLKGQTAKTALEEDSLKDLAGKAGGQYVHLDPNTTLPIDWVGNICGSRLDAGELDLSRYLYAATLLVLTTLSLRGLWRRRDVFAPVGA